VYFHIFSTKINNSRVTQMIHIIFRRPLTKFFADFPDQTNFQKATEIGPQCFITGFFVLLMQLMLHLCDKFADDLDTGWA